MLPITSSTKMPLASSLMFSLAEITWTPFFFGFEAVLSKNFETYFGDDLRVPLYVLAEGLDGSCWFLRKGRRLIQQDKPAVCAFYPLGCFFDGRDNSFRMPAAVMSDGLGENLDPGGMA